MNKIETAKQMVKELVQKLDNPKSLSQVFIGGSLARKFHDQYSDIELVFVYHDADFHEICECIELHEHMKMELSETTIDGTQLDCLFFQNEKIDLMHITHQTLQNKLDQFNNMTRVDPSTQAIVSCYQNPTLIWTNPCLQTHSLHLKINGQHFCKIIEYGINQFTTQMLKIHIYRNDSIMIQQSLFSIQRAFLITLFAINKTLMPGYKQLNNNVSLLENKPNNFLKKLDEISKDRSLNLVRMISTLYTEVRDLCQDQNMLQLLPKVLEFESMRTKKR